MNGRIFIDHQNLLKRWLPATGGSRVDWLQIPGVLGAAARQKLVEKGRLPETEPLKIVESRLFTSQFRADDSRIALLAADRNLDVARLRAIRTKHESTAGALTSLLTPPDWKVILGEVNVERADELVCMACDRPTTQCEWCRDDLVTMKEKGVDMRLGVDLVEHAWLQRVAVANEGPGARREHPLDVAIVVSSDADLVPALLNAKGKGILVVNAAWRTNTGRLPGAATASFYIDDHLASLTLAVPPNGGH